MDLVLTTRQPWELETKELRLRLVSTPDDHVRPRHQKHPHKIPNRPKKIQNVVPKITPKKA